MHATRSEWEYYTYGRRPTKQPVEKPKGPVSVVSLRGYMTVTFGGNNYLVRVISACHRKSVSTEEDLRC